MSRVKYIRIILGIITLYLLEALTQVNIKIIFLGSDFQFLTLTVSHCESNNNISCASKEKVDHYF